MQHSEYNRMKSSTRLMQRCSTSVYRILAAKPSDLFMSRVQEAPKPACTLVPREAVGGLAQDAEQCNQATAYAAKLAAHRNNS